MTERTISNFIRFCFSQRTITGDKIYEIGDGKIAFIKDLFKYSTFFGFLLGMFYGYVYFRFPFKEVVVLP